MMGRQVIVVERAFKDECQIEREAAGQHGVAIEPSDARTALELAHQAADAAGVIVRFLPLDAAIIAGARWRVIGRYGVGVDNVDVDAASRQGIAVINVPDYCIEEVATHALAFILAAWRRLDASRRLIAGGRWDAWSELGPVRPLSECTLGLVGIGRIGGTLARFARPLFGSILAADPNATSPPPGVETVDLDQLVARADVISLHCPLTAETQALFDAARLAAMRPGSLLVNVSRGGLIDAAALVAALDAGVPALAALDVLSEEPPTEHDPLLSHPAALITNHVAWYSTRSLSVLRQLVADRCAAWLAGDRVASVLNAKQLEAKPG